MLDINEVIINPHDVKIVPITRLTLVPKVDMIMPEKIPVKKYPHMQIITDNLVLR